MKIYRIYEVIDSETGELLKKENRKNYITINTEVSKKKENGYTIETTRRIVKHNGQQTINGIY
jgi:hypothetical protein